MKCVQLLASGLICCVSAAAISAPIAVISSVPYGQVKLPAGDWQQTAGPEVAIDPEAHSFTAPALEGGSLSFKSGNQTLTVKVDECYDGIGTLFKNCIDPTWQEAKGNSKAVQWQLIDAGSQRNQVIDVKFGEELGQRFAIHAGAHSDPNTPHTWLDLSAFKNGKLVFDVRVLDFAENLNGLEVSLGCGSNCQSAPLGIYPTQAGQWQTVSIAVNDLIADGLEISQVQTGFEIYPVDGEQANVHVQLDNIHFEANIPAPMDLVAL